MITYVDSNNQVQYLAYQDLFNKASETLNLTEENYIDSLESYFGHIEELKAADLKYTILPLQEEYFEIDANARTIRVPENFRKNGLAVQGDNTAETVYFKIHRYYDAIDLNNTDIWIQWETNDSKGIANEYVRDIETFDDCMVFGWTIGSNMTKTAGNISFSVRFVIPVYNADDPKKIDSVSYSLSTLTASAVINPALNPNATDSEFVIDNSANTTLLTNFKDTTSKTDSDIQVFKFIKDLDTLNQDPNNTPETTLLAIADLTPDLDAEGQPTGTYSLPISVQAFANPGTESYFLYRQAGSIPSSFSDTKIEMKKVYKRTTDTTVLNYKKYYEILIDPATGEPAVDSSGNPVYDRKGLAVGTEIKPTEELYEAFGETVLSGTVNDNTEITGKYYAAAISTLSNGRKSSPKPSTYSLIISEPEEAVISNTKTTGYQVDSEIDLKIEIPDFNEVSYQWYNTSGPIAGATNEKFTPTTEDWHYVEVTTTRNTDQKKVSNKTNPICVTNPTVAPTITYPEKGTQQYGLTSPLSVVAHSEQPRVEGIEMPQPVITYQWYTARYNASNSKYELVAPILNATSSKYQPTATGDYICKVTSTYNEHEASANSPAFQVLENNQ